MQSSDEHQQQQKQQQIQQQQQEQLKNKNNEQITNHKQTIWLNTTTHLTSQAGNQHANYINNKYVCKYINIYIFYINIQALSV